MNWRGEELLRRLERQVGQRIDAALTVVQNHAKGLLSVDGTAKVLHDVTYSARNGLKARYKLVYGANPSKPGEPPHVQTGRLRASVAQERVGLVGRVGTNVTYGRILELFGPGGNGQTRPWLRRALVERVPAVNAILNRPIDLGR